MIVLDTNVFVRALVTLPDDDDASIEQTRAARALVRRAVAAEVDLYVPVVVLVETWWLLTRRYRFERATVLTTLLTATAARGLTVEDTPTVRAALHALRDPKLDLVECLLRALSRERGTVVASFDQAFVTRGGGAHPDTLLMPTEPTV